MPHSSTVSLVLASCVLTACAGAPKPATTRHAPPPPPARTVTLTEACPMLVAGTVVTSEPIEDGAAYVFTTTTDVAELRRRVRIIARLHAERTSGVIAATDDVASGARLKLRPVEVTQAALLQDQASQRAAVLAAGSCPSVAPEALVDWLVRAPADSGRVLTRR